MYSTKILPTYCKERNFLYLKGKNVLQPKVSEIIADFLKEGSENYIELGNNLSQCKIIFQYVYSNVFPEIYCSTERREFDLKSTFHITFKTYTAKKKKKKKKKKKEKRKRNRTIGEKSSKL